MLAQRRRRWANISPTLGCRLVFAGDHWITLASQLLPAIAPCRDGQMSVHSSWKRRKLKSSRYVRKFILISKTCKNIPVVRNLLQVDSLLILIRIYDISCLLNIVRSYVLYLQFYILIEIALFRLL